MAENVEQERLVHFVWTADASSACVNAAKRDEASLLHGPSRILPKTDVTVVFYLSVVGGFE